MPKPLAIMELQYSLTILLKNTTLITKREIQISG